MRHDVASVLERLRQGVRHALSWPLSVGMGRHRGVRTSAPPPTSLVPGAERRAHGPAVAQPLALALQGGGSHGAFTWGVLDRLLEDPTLPIEAISGTSAGALNAVALAAGALEGGREGARAKLDALWRTVTNLGRLNPLQPTLLERLALGWNADESFSHTLSDLLSHILSPYQLNPLGLNPLRDILARLIDFERLDRPDAMRLFIAATRLETGEGRVFTNAELSPDVLLASACLPSFHHAVRLDDGHYWDGGFSANPALLPLIEHCEAHDILLVRLNPTREDGLPVTASEIRARLNRLIFEAPLKRELEALAALRRALEQAGATASPFGHRLARLRIHSIGNDAVMRRLGATSKLHPDKRLVGYLKEVGRAAAADWLAQTDAGQTPARAANNNEIPQVV